MSKIIAVIELGTLLQTISYINAEGEMETQLELPIDNVPEAIAYCAHEKNVNHIIIFGKNEYSEQIKTKVISKSQKEYGHANYTFELKEIN